MDQVYVLNPKILEKKHLVIFGTGKLGKELFTQMLQRNIKVDYFADRNPEICGLELYGIKVIMEDDLIGMDCAVLIASAYWEDIEKRLREKGIENLYTDFNKVVQGEIVL